MQNKTTEMSHQHVGNDPGITDANRATPADGSRLTDILGRKHAPPDH